MLLRKIPQDNIDQAGKVTLGVWLDLPFLTDTFFPVSVLVAGNRLTVCKTFSVDEKQHRREEERNSLVGQYVFYIHLQ